MRKSDNRSIIFGIIGVLMIALGTVLIIIGNNMNKDFYVNVEYYFAHGKWDSSGSNTVIAGIVLAVIGAILVFVALLFSMKFRRKFSKKLHNQEYDEVDDVITQLAGNRTIFDIFHSGDRNRTFSFYRNKTCIFKAGDKICRGTMEPLTWEAGHPTLWRITLDTDGEKVSYEVSKVEGNIRVKSKNGEEIFYRN